MFKKVIYFFAFLLLFACAKTTKSSYKNFEGNALGTTFHISLEQGKYNLSEKQIDSLIYLINKSLSTYIPNSDISKINSGDSTIVVDDLFNEVFQKSKKIYKQTNGAFDPTIGILVNAWGFGPNGEVENLDSVYIDSMLDFVGFQNVEIQNHLVKKKYLKTYLDFNAIAKGFTVDFIGRFFEQMEVKNYMIEIGGEIRARGVSTKNTPWKIAIEEPHFDGTRSFQNTISLKNESIATSGNYRKFKLDKNGNKYAHTIDTKTGFPSKSNLLSASVISTLDCADVDAYATAFMAMGLEKTKIFLKKHSELKAFLIYSDDNGAIATFKTKNLEILN